MMFVLDVRETFMACGGLILSASHSPVGYEVGVISPRHWVRLVCVMETITYFEPRPNLGRFSLDHFTVQPDLWTRCVWGDLEIVIAENDRAPAAEIRRLLGSQE